MSIVPDPVLTGVAIAATVQVAKQAQEFIASLAGRPGQSIGTILGDLARRRFENIEAVGNKAHLILLNIGVKHQEVPLNILQPLLECASLQEDPGLQDIWANLLANAADPREINPVTTAFPRVLVELGPREVIFLDALYINTLERMPSDPMWQCPEDVTYSMDAIRDVYWKAGLSPRRLSHITHGDLDNNPMELRREQGIFRITMDVLERHKLIEKPPELRRNLDPIRSNPSLEQVVRLSAFGRSFICACRAPEAT